MFGGNSDGNIVGQNSFGIKVFARNSVGGNSVGRDSIGGYKWRKGL